MRQLKALLLLFVVFVISCGSNQTERASNSGFIKDIKLKEALNLINSTDVIVVLDVRTPQEFASGHIKGAININIGDADFKSKIENLDRDKTYFVYCASGYRSSGTINLMKKLNFKFVYHMDEGIAGWGKAGYPVEK